MLYAWVITTNAPPRKVHDSDERELEKLAFDDHVLHVLIFSEDNRPSQVISRLGGNLYEAYAWSHDLLEYDTIEEFEEAFQP